MTALPRRGRPPRIDRSAIVKAALEIGTDGMTLRRVATHLGVSLPGLYHHVRNQDELLSLVTEGALTESPPPRYAGEDWATWLRRYATYIRTVLAAQPALLEKFICGVANPDGELEYVGEALDALTSQGLAPEQAIAAWAAVSAMAIGSVSEAHREHLQASTGQPWLARIITLIGRRPASDHPALRSIAESRPDPFGAEAFQQRITLLLSGIAVEYGLTLD
jgi:AcrR family transcriptional regulator